MSKNTKALVNNIIVGQLQFEGLMLPDGSFGISLQQLRELAFPSVTQNNALREFKSSCGKDFQLLKSKTELNNNPQWIITIDQLNYCLTELAFKGHKEARNLVRLLSGLSLHQLYCDAFNIKFEKEERQQWLLDRQQHRQQYRPLVTYWIARDGIVNSWEYGYRVNQLKRLANLPIDNLENYNTFQIQQLNEVEIRYDMLRKIDKSHEESLQLLF